MTESEAAPDAPASCAQLLDSARPLIYSKRLVEATRARLDARTPSLVIATGLVVAPLCVDRLLSLVDLGSSLEARGWLSCYALLDLALLTFPEAAWRRLVALGPALDQLLNETDRAAFARGLAARLRPRAHFFVCLAGAALGLVGTVLARFFLPVHTFQPAYYLAIIFTGFLAADGVRWLVRTPQLILLPLRKVEELRVNPVAPVQTPAFREISSLLGRMALQAAAGLLLFAVPLVWVIVDANGAEVALGLLCAVPGAIGLATALYIAFVPQLWLSGIISREQERILDRLTEELRDADSPMQLVGQLDTTIRLHQTIAASPTRTLEARAIFGRTALILTAAIPYLYGALVKLAGLSAGPGSQ